MGKTDAYGIVSMALVLTENENPNYGNGSDRTYPKNYVFKGRDALQMHCSDSIYKS